MQINMLLFPDMTQLDMTGPFEVLTRGPGYQVDLVAADLNPVHCRGGLSILPSAMRETAPPADILVIPGGQGTTALMADALWLAFIRQQAAQARAVMAVCTGSLVLGAAGLLQGKTASTHWQSRDLLAAFGAAPSDQRVSIDGNLYTAGGVTAGIDIALRLIAALEGPEIAQRIQLQIEYDPQPPFDAGAPDKADPDILSAALKAGEAAARNRRSAVNAAAAKLSL